MTGKGRRHRPRQVDKSEHALWTKAVRDVEPIRRGGNVGTTRQPEAKEESAGPASGEGSRRIEQPAVNVSRPATPATSPPLTGLDRRTRQRLARGQAEYEARLDLHGLTLERARVVLQRFLAESAAKGRRLVLVITGKGAAPIARHTLHGTGYFDTPERQGRLRRALPSWLAEPEIRAYVTGYQPAHPRHGGGGAFYIRIRRHDRLEKFR